MVWINIKGTAVISVISAVLCFLINMLNYIHEEGHADSYNLLRSCSKPHMYTLDGIEEQISSLPKALAMWAFKRFGVC